MANIVLDELDNGLERRGLRFVRYADNLKFPLNGATEHAVFLIIVKRSCRARRLDETAGIQNIGQISARRRNHKNENTLPRAIAGETPYSQADRFVPKYPHYN